MIFIGFCELIASLFYSIVCCQGGMNDDEHRHFQLFLNYLTERHHNNIYQNIQQDADYLETTLKESELNEQYKKLDLSDEQQKVITQWIDAIQAQNSAYTAVVFRMGTQLCFFLLIQLADS